MHCLQRDPDDRFANAAELRTALNQFLFHGSQPGRADELLLFAEQVLQERKRQKEAILQTMRNERVWKKQLFKGMDDQLPTIEFDRGKSIKAKSYTSLRPAQTAQAPSARVAEPAPGPRTGSQGRLVTVLAGMIFGALGVGAWFLFTPLAPAPSQWETAVATLIGKEFTPQTASWAEVQALTHSDQPSARAQADQILRTMLDQDRNNLPAFAAWAQNLSFRHQDPAACPLCPQALALLDLTLPGHPNLDALQRAKAFLHVRLRQFPQARKSARKALALDRSNPENLLAMGASFLIVNPARAIRTLRKAKDIQPNLMATYRLLAEAYLHRGQFRFALRTLNQSQQQLPHQSQSLLRMARIYLQVGRLDQAREIFATLRADHPPKPRWHWPGPGQKTNLAKTPCKPWPS